MSGPAAVRDRVPAMALRTTRYEGDEDPDPNHDYIVGNAPGERGYGGGYARSGWDDDSFAGNSASDPNRGRPGYVQAEDGSWVPADYWDKAKGKTGTNSKTGEPIIW